MASCPSESNAVPSSPSPQRILSVDALRGFDMFWLIGGNAFVMAILPFCGSKVRGWVLPQLNHVRWEGFAFHDLIFPLFVFLVGMSTVFSLSRLLAEKGKSAAYRRLFRRSLVLFLLGVFYYGGFANRWPDIRLLGVLQRLALCYLFSGILFIHFRMRGLAIAIGVILIGYWALLSFVPVPGEDPEAVPASRFAQDKNLANYIDSKFLIGKLNNKTWDPEGLLSTIPSVATCLFGVLAALLLRNPAVSDRAKLGCFFGCGALCLLLGYAWGGQIEGMMRSAMGSIIPVKYVTGYPFPIIKKIWTSSYVLVAGGYSLLLLGTFYAVIDMWKWQRWAVPFFWIGTNAITLYIVCNPTLVDFGQIAQRIAGGDVQCLLLAMLGDPLGEQVGKLLLASVALGLVLTLARFLYRHKIFLRV
jgi:predicted acyltransferase